MRTGYSVRGAVSQVKLHLHDHCIETEAKRELKRLMDLYFESDDKAQVIEEQIQILEKFLNRSDFPTLRASDERLSGIVESVVYVSIDEDDTVQLQIEGA